VTCWSHYLWPAVKEAVETNNFKEHKAFDLGCGNLSQALALMGRYPSSVALDDWHHRPPKSESPFLAPRKAFGWTETERRVAELHRAGSICVLMLKSR